MFFRIKLGTRHLQVFLMFLGVSLTCAGRFGISVAVVAMTDSNSTDVNYPTYDWDSEAKAIILSSFFWGYVLMQIPSGIVADIYSAHKLVCFGVFLSSLINLLIPVSVHYFGWTGIIVCRVLMGTIQSGLIPCSHSFISKWIPYEERSRLGSFALVGPQFGIIITFIASGWLANSSLGWPSIFYIFGVIGMFWAVLFYYVAADSPSKHRSISLNEKHYIESSLRKSASSESKLKLPWKSMLTSLPLWTLIITNCGHSWGFQLFLHKLPAYIKYALGYDIGQSGFMSALPYVATLIMTFFFGWMSDLVLKKGVSLSIIRKVSNTIGMWGASIALLVLCLISTDSKFVHVIILITIFGLDAANYCGFHINHIDIAPNFAGAQIAIFNAVALAFGQTAPLVCGYIVTDETNIYQWHVVFYITAGLYFVSNLIFVTFGKTKVQSWN